jgi:hypothetical protein
MFNVQQEMKMDTVQQILDEKRSEGLLLSLCKDSALLADSEGDIVAEYEISEAEFEQLKAYADQLCDD